MKRGSGSWSGDTPDVHPDRDGGARFGVGVANASLTVIAFNDDEPPGVVVFNDMSHLPVELRWTGFADGGRV